MKNILLAACATAVAACATAGNRPYEFVDAGRTEDAHPALVDFEKPLEWKVRCWDAEATFARSQDEQLFGDWTAKLAYRVTGRKPRISLRLAEGLPLPKGDFDTMSLWVRGQHFTMGANRTPGETPPLLTAVFRRPDGSALTYRLGRVIWKDWFMPVVRFPQGDIPKLRESTFVGFEVTNLSRREERVIHIDSIAIYKEEFKPLDLKPRPKRNLTPLPGADQGMNTGAGTLPFPTREETILPDVAEPLPGEPLAQYSGGAGGGRVKTTMRRVGRTLIVDFTGPAGAATEISSGLPTEGRFIKGFHVPYLSYDGGGGRVMVDMLEPPAKRGAAGASRQPMFRLAMFDWYRSNASSIRIRNTPKGCEVCAIYGKKSDGTYNPVSERLFITLSPDFDGVLPNIPNPPSPWKAVTGSVTWRSHASYNREADKKLWRAVHRHGIRDLLITDHETMWREGGESFTMRTKADPSKGGDEGQRDYTRFLIDELGYRYGPYNNFTDFAPANAYWTPDWVTRQASMWMRGGWMRCYAFRAAAAPQACETIAPILQKKFGFNTAYCDVHTAINAWDRTDFDSRVPGAGTYSEVFYDWGETLLLQKKAWNGPVWSEGGHHFFFAGLCDGNYGQDRGRPYGTNPWLVDFDVLKIHPLETDFGMGCLSMFMPNKSGQNGYVPEAPTPQALTNVIDRFICATLAFGHSGYLILDSLFDPPRPFGLAYCGPGKMALSENGFATAMKSHFMTQQIASRYTQAQAVKIEYADDKGQWLPTSAAIAADAVKRCQVRVEYDDGTVVVANGNEAERLKSGDVDLPPRGYWAKSGDGAVVVASDDAGGVRADYCESPKYIYIDGRGREAVRGKARAAGTALCRKTDYGWEIISLGNRPCAFRLRGPCSEEQRFVAASDGTKPVPPAIALDFDGNEIGPAEVSVADGWLSVKPVPGAFSYKVSAIDK